jgi:hypothetical protein
MAALVTGAMVTALLTTGAGVASAGPCDTVAPGEWLGTWAQDGSTAGGVVKFNLTFTATTVSGVMEFATGQGVFAGDDTVSGTRGAGSCTFTADIGGLVTISGGIASNGAEISGGYLYHPNPPTITTMGTFQLGRVTSSASTNGTDLTTDPLDEGVSPSVPLVSDVSSPTPGPITINQALFTGGSLHGFSVLNTIVRITAPAATAAAPLALTFDLDRSVTGGLAPSALTLNRNGVPVALCLGAVPPITTDPCVSVREALVVPQDGVRFTVLTSAASTWAFTTPAVAPKGLRITTTGFPAAHLGQAFSKRLDAAGGIPPLKWKKRGKLPKGLKLSRDGVLSGVPTKAGVYRFTVNTSYKIKVKKKPSILRTASKNYTISVT